MPDAPVPSAEARLPEEAITAFMMAPAKQPITIYRDDLVTALTAALPFLYRQWEADLESLAREVCPEMDRDGLEEGCGPYLLLGEDGDPIIDAETPLDAIGQALDRLKELWVAIEDRRLVQAARSARATEGANDGK
jgi:hypothetical protein